MATAAENLERFQLISDRGLQDRLDPDKRARFDIALSRGLITTLDTVKPDPLVEPEQQTFQERPTGEKALGVLGAGAQLVSGALAEPIAGLVGLGAAILPGETGAGARAVEATREALTIDAGEAGQQFLQESITGLTGKGEQILGGVPAVAVTGAIDLQTQLAQQAAEAGNPGLATAIKTLPTAALEAVPAALGIRAAGRAAGITPRPDVPETIVPQRGGIDEVTQAAGDVKETVFNPQTVNKREVAEKIVAGSNDVDTATFELVPSQRRREGAAPRVQVDKTATEAVKQGFSRGSIADFKVSNPETKQKFSSMVDIAEKIKNNERFGMRNRPSDVLGDSLMDRLRLIQDANKRSGVRVSAEAKNLRGKPINIDQAANNFLDGLDEIGISINEAPRNAAGEITGPQTLNFKGSDIEGATGAENAINKVFKRMSDPKAFDGAEVHRLKNFIDEQVSFGKNAEGLGGVAERKLKELRFEIKETLNETFPKYGEANKVYSETIDALDSFQDVAGNKMNLTGPNADKATGTLMRRLMGNAQSRITLLDSIDLIEDVAKRHGGFTGQTLIGKGKKIGFVDDLENQVLMANQLDKVFGIAPGTSLQGIFDASLAKTAARSAVTGSPTEVVLDIAGKVISKTRGVNEEAGFKAIRELIKKEAKKKP